MKTFQIKRRRGWHGRQRNPQRKEPAEDHGNVLVEEEVADEDSWLFEGTLDELDPLQLYGSELKAGPFDPRVDVPAPRRGPLDRQGPIRDLKHDGSRRWDTFLNLWNEGCWYRGTKDTRSKWKDLAIDIWATGATTGEPGEFFLPVECDVLIAILQSRRLWLRPLDHWRKPAGTRLDVLIHLTEHLLGFYEVPEWLNPRNFLSEFSLERDPRYHVWHRSSYTSSLRMPWITYIAATQGLKLGPALNADAKRLGIDLPSAAAGYAFEVPAHLRLISAFQWLLVRVNGGTPDFAERLARTLPVQDAGWIHSLIRMFIQAPELAGYSRLIIEWVKHQESEVHRNSPGQSFSLTGRSPARVLESTMEYLESLKRKHSNRVWEAHGWETVMEEEGVTWNIHELYSEYALQEESQAMRHCVVTYGCACASGLSAIFSVKADGLRMVTVEVNPGTRRVVQVRGFANRMPTAQESRIVNRWCEQFNLEPRRI